MATAFHPGGSIPSQRIVGTTPEPFYFSDTDTDTGLDSAVGWQRSKIENDDDNDNEHNNFLTSSSFQPTLALTPTTLPSETAERFLIFLGGLFDYLRRQTRRGRGFVPV